MTDPHTPDSPMDDRLDDLLDQYQELLDAGRVPNLADLCRDCPDLRDELGRRVVRLHRLGALLGDGPSTCPGSGTRPVPSPPCGTRISSRYTTSASTGTSRTSRLSSAPAGPW